MSVSTQLLNRDLAMQLEEKKEMRDISAIFKVLLKLTKYTQTNGTLYYNHRWEILLF